MAESEWRIAAASALGSSHEHLGTPCQDSHACRVFKDLDGNSVLVLVASDGAGSAARAEIGSDLACTTILESVETYLADGGLIKALNFDTAQRWLEDVQEAIDFRAHEDEDSPRNYACTLLVAVLADDAAAFLQLGDGAIVVADPEWGWSWVHWPQRGEFANATYFVTQPEAIQRLAFELVERRIEEVAVFTDGIESLVLHYATRSVHGPFFDRMFTPVRQLTEAGLNAELGSALEHYLQSEAVLRRTDDDKTLILASRLPVSGPFQAPLPETRPETDDEVGEETPQESAHENAEEKAEESAEESAKESAEETVKEPTEESAGETHGS